jgi:hypothetical protein
VAATTGAASADGGTAPQVGQNRLLGLRGVWQLGQERDILEAGAAQSMCGKYSINFYGGRSMKRRYWPQMIRFCFHGAPRWSAIGAAALVSAISSSAQPVTGAPADQAVRVQITEVGLLRTLVMVDEDSRDMHQRLVSELLKRDFMVFEAPELAPAGINTREMSAAGETAGADLVVHASVTDMEIDRTGGALRYSAEASVKIVNRVNNRTLAWNQPDEVRGERSTRPERARRSARAKAIDGAVKNTVEQLLASAHKMLVHRAVIVNVFSESALLAIMEYMGKMDGVYHVKRLDFDRQTNEALIEVIGSPQSVTFWRAYLEKLPRTKVDVQVTPNDTIRNKYPDWFLPPR